MEKRALCRFTLQMHQAMAHSPYVGPLPMFEQNKKVNRCVSIERLNSILAVANYVGKSQKSKSEHERTTHGDVPPDTIESDYFYIALYIFAGILMNSRESILYPDKTLTKTQKLTLLNRYVLFMGKFASGLFSAWNYEDVHLVIPEAIYDCIDQSPTPADAAYELYNLMLLYTDHGSNHSKLYQIIHRVGLLTMVFEYFDYSSSVFCIDELIEDDQNGIFSHFLDLDLPLSSIMNPMDIRILASDGSFGEEPDKKFDALLKSVYSKLQRAQNKNEINSKGKSVAYGMWEKCGILFECFYWYQRTMNSNNFQSSFTFEPEFMFIFNMPLETSHLKAPESLEYDECVYPFHYSEQLDQLYYTPYRIIDSSLKFNALLESYIRHNVESYVNPIKVLEYNQNYGLRNHSPIILKAIKLSSINEIHKIVMSPYLASDIVKIDQTRLDFRKSNHVSVDGIGLWDYDIVIL